LPDLAAVVSVAIGQWKVAAAPVKVRTLLGSCVGVVLYDRVAKVGGIAHIVLPLSRGVPDHPGKYANTAIPALISDLYRKVGNNVRARLTAKLVGGANMFQMELSLRESSGLNIGQKNQEAIEQILAELTIPVLARDLGGTAGRRLTLDTVSGIVTINVPGGNSYDI
jgi:chemotaxis protein CheD